MNKFRALILIGISLLNISCKKESLIVNPKNNDTLKQAEPYVWKVSLVNSQAIVGSITPIATENENVVFSSRGVGPYEVFQSYDCKSGSIQWKWSDYLRDEEYFYGNSILKLNENIVLCKNNSTYSFNSNTGKTNWKDYTDTMFGSKSIYFLDGYLYHGFHGEKGTFNYYLFRKLPNSIQWEYFTTIHDTTELFDRMYETSMTLYKDSIGTSIVLTLTNGGSNIPCAQFLSINIQDKSVNWMYNYSTLYSEFSLIESVSTNNSLVTFASLGSYNHLISLNLKTGKIDWDKVLLDFGTSIKLVESRIIYTVNRSNSIKIIDYLNGSNISELILRDNNFQDAYFGFYDISAFKKYIFITSNRTLYILDITNSKVVCSIKLVDDSHTISNGVAINEKLRYFYVADEQYAYCFKLPDIVKY